jgi:aryl-phospho-beta-D-glucosidase BglC (GH1 family)
MWQNGVNLGGWLSQYPSFNTTEEAHLHFETFITQDDIKRIAGWGLDHIRLPVDYPVLDGTDDDLISNASGIDYIDRCLEWCHSAKISAVLDLHKAPGFSFDSPELHPLFTEPGLQARLVGLWQMLADRYAGYGEALGFELLNEIVLPDVSPWNQLARKLLAAIRKIDANRWVIVGGNYYNAARELKNLALPTDPYLIYTFHFYEPMIITHQKAAWVPVLRDFNSQVHYPGFAPDMAEFSRKFPRYAQWVAENNNRELNSTLVRSFLEPAFEYAAQTGLPLYCGEFGVIDQAPPSTRVSWTHDVIELLDQANIGHALWTYKALDFGLLDAQGQVVNEDLLELLKD